MPVRISEITDRIMSASATIIARLALGAGLYQAKLSRDHARPAAWATTPEKVRACTDDPVRAFRR